MKEVHPPIQVERFQKHLTIADKSATAIDTLSANTNLSKQKLKQAMHKGAVWLTQGRSTRRLRRASKILNSGDMLHIYYDSQILSQSELNAQLISDEQDYSVWFKPAGMLSQGSKYGDHCTIYRWAETQLKPQRNAFPVHRLDKATSGLILIAHSKKAAKALSELFSDRKVDKYYKALVKGVPEVPQTVNMPLDDKPATTKLLDCIKSLDECYSLLDIQILTGRKHQIRQHLSSIGYPIVGDRLYDGEIKINNKNYDLGLTAYKMSFISPFDNCQKHYELSSKFYPSFPE